MQNFNNGVYYNQSKVSNQAPSAQWVNYDDQGLQGGNSQYQMAPYTPPPYAYEAVPPHFGASAPIIPPQLPQHDASMDTMNWFNKPIPMEPFEVLDLNDYPGRADFLANYHAGPQDEVAEGSQPATSQAQSLPQLVQAPLPIQPLAPVIAQTAPYVATGSNNSALLPFANVPAATPHPNVTVELRDKDLWSAFYDKSNEMIMTIWGKEIFPRLSFTVNGLNCDGRYQWSIRLVRTTPFLKKWDTKSKSWKINKKEGQGPQESIELFSQINLGSAWMKGGVSFDKVQVYNVPGAEKLKKMSMDQKKDWEEKTKGKMALSSFCTYQPVLTLNEICCNGRAMMATLRGVFRFVETEFVAVTEYRNDEIKKLKIVHTPYIDKTRKRKAQEGDVSVKRRRRNSGDDSGFSSQSSSASSADTTPVASPPPVDFQFFGFDGSAPSTSGY
ncbi:hypothetical protein CAEBREN_13598 [Caenorhabditis brenneri]|uniref:T-box domain-containing protein n=1 Tax=Caenorhabditis brenneri TaxID=135651 RepID=G0NVB0_CAEBE|nr:hypothetical protein CAEBREN_13598 [Caenorhabditis brenneri]